MRFGRNSNDHEIQNDRQLGRRSPEADMGMPECGLLPCLFDN
jgi:hypothetical protein